MREYYAAHCPISIKDAYDVWAGERAMENGARVDSLMSMGLRSGTERAAFLSWWALMRFEYADAMMAENLGKGLGE